MSLGQHGEHSICQEEVIQKLTKMGVPLGIGYPEAVKLSLPTILIDGPAGGYSRRDS